MFERVRAIAARLRLEVNVYRLVLRHPRTPWTARVLLALAVGYILLPFDLIPDFIPGLGHLDDAVIVPALLLLALRFVPPDVIAECRRRAGDGSP